MNYKKTVETITCKDLYLIMDSDNDREAYESLIETYGFFGEIEWDEEAETLFGDLDLIDTLVENGIIERVESDFDPDLVYIVVTDRRSIYKIVRFTSDDLFIGAFLGKEGGKCSTRLFSKRLNDPLSFTDLKEICECRGWEVKAYDNLSDVIVEYSLD